MLKEKYNPKDFEEELYQRWEEKGYFKPSMDKTKENYCIMMPPPNVTGKLHMGHALDDTIQDILIRFKECKDITHYGFQVQTIHQFQQK